MGYSGEEVDNLDIGEIDEAGNPIRLDLLTIPDQMKRLEKKRDEMRQKKRILCSQLQQK